MTLTVAVDWTITGDQFGDEDDDSETPLITGGAAISSPPRLSRSSSMQTPPNAHPLLSRHDSDSDSRSARSVKFKDRPGTVYILLDD